jgi:hypothetical protein
MRGSLADGRQGQLTSLMTIELMTGPQSFGGSPQPKLLALLSPFGEYRAVTHATLCPASRSVARSLLIAKLFHTLAVACNKSQEAEWAFASSVALLRPAPSGALSFSTRADQRAPFLGLLSHRKGAGMPT